MPWTRHPCLLPRGQTNPVKSEPPHFPDAQSSGHCMVIWLWLSFTASRVLHCKSGTPTGDEKTWYWDHLVVPNYQTIENPTIHLPVPSFLTYNQQWSLRTWIIRMSSLLKIIIPTHGHSTLKVGSLLRCGCHWSSVSYLIPSSNLYWLARL